MTDNISLLLHIGESNTHFFDSGHLEKSYECLT